ncbi:Soluble aldose sugar dehydrogenase YliI precursor [Corynebacterium faecale]|uniref:PQQ-dependent sugar dehydrogenase n=1 Tax=Corynebacterium faecale TaxID=1758466 RepID=UPI0025B44A70|nr:PQQ-dependent sugar dehydrogenase [Corynebacterium faecale]WJY91971.1 Soluble aldose sugar dehydrogenase YliI precursor [Corynebacterium faecale]
MFRFAPLASFCIGAITLLNACGLGSDDRAVGSSTAGSSTVSSSGSSTSNRIPTEETIEATDVATDLEAPWSVTFHDGATLISERDTARILEVSADGATRVVSTIEEARPRGEGGLLGIAMHEDFLYAYYTAADDNQIARLPITGDPGALTLGPAEVIFASIPKAGTHNGGRIAFGPDGMLYATTGDANQPDTAQDDSSLAGKILRLTPEGNIPADNPFPGSPVYSLGHRNPQGIAWDDQETMYSSEFGQSTWDELNIITPGGNYGWPTVEGIASRDGFIDPVQQWRPSEASPSGIAVAGDSIFIANLRGQSLREVPVSSPETSRVFLHGEFGRLRDVVTAPDGTLRILTNNTDGRGSPTTGDDRMLRIDPTTIAATM